MRTIHFKNGSTKEVSQEIVDMLTQVLEKSGVTFQSFRKKGDSVDLVINVYEIVYID